MFLAIAWYDGVCKWRLLGDAHVEIDKLFVDAPASAIVLQFFAQYLMSLGEPSMPGAVALVDRQFGVSSEPRSKNRVPRELF